MNAEREYQGGTVRRPWAATATDDGLIIPISGGQSFIVDEGDFHLIAPFAWCISTGANTSYAVTQKDRKSIMAHRLIMAAPSQMCVDHRNGNGLDNRRSNLRLCTRAENNRHRLSGTGKSRFKGAAFHRASGLYHSTICVNSKQISLGYHRTQEDAARAYDAAAVEHFGEFALTNQKSGAFDAR